MIFPISFSIPQSKIIKDIPRKTLYTAKYKPGQPYSYSNEKDYYQGYAESVFGYTKKKSGWDCMRHYEILANGCIPWFEDLDKCPPNTMTHFPKELVSEAMSSIQDIHDPKIPDYIQRLLEYTRTHLTTNTMASYILDKSGNTTAKSALILTNHEYPDYIVSLTIHGFKELFGTNCHDLNKIDLLYTDYNEDINELYGKGVSYTRLLDPSMRDPLKDKTIMKDIIQHNYDIIVFPQLYREMPYLEIVEKYYKPSEIIFILAEDEQHDLQDDFFKDKTLFVREL